MKLFWPLRASDACWWGWGQPWDTETAVNTEPQIPKYTATALFDAKSAVLFLHFLFYTFFFTLSFYIFYTFFYKNIAKYSRYQRNRDRKRGASEIYNNFSQVSHVFLTLRIWSWSIRSICGSVATNCNSKHSFFCGITATAPHLKKCSISWVVEGASLNTENLFKIGRA